MISELSILEKAALLSGESVWQTRAVPRAGIRQLSFADGPHGIRQQTGEGDHLGIHASEPATCFPTAATVANSWDLALGERIGAAIGAEAAALGVDVVLGPGLNIKRSPLCGRNFEYFSEDPRLSGEFAAAYVRGIQSAGVAACPKHFAANSQETLRMVTDSVVDERTLREIYLTGFERVVREADPQTLMSSYNMVNGEYAHENHWLLTEVLREEWGFGGAVISDWGGSNDAIAAAQAGGTLEMPSPGFDSVHQLVQAVESGQLSEAVLTARAEEIVQLARRIPVPRRGEIAVEDHHSLARRAAAESAVLLKNAEALLPLKPGTRTAVIGDFAVTPRYQGAGSSLVNPTALSTGEQAAIDSSLEVTGVAQGYRRNSEHDPALAAEAVRLAARSDVVMLWIGLDEISESEGQDRHHLRLPANQLQLLTELRTTGTPVVVVLSGGSVVEVSWMDQAEAVLHSYLSGQGGAEGVLDVITGEVNPSGRLAETYPLSLEDTPTAATYPAAGDSAAQRRIQYTEGPLVGYRWYSSAGLATALPFGFGLSYTTFEYSDLETTAEAVFFTLTNTGDRRGAEVAQLYAQRTSTSGVLRPKRELIGFTKVVLRPGESARLSIPLDDLAFRHWDTTSAAWHVESGVWELLLGAHVEDVRLRASHEVHGSVKAGHGAEEQLTELVAAVQKIQTEARRASTASAEAGDRSGQRALGMNSTLGDMSRARSPLARGGAAVLRRLLAQAEAKGTPDLNLLFLTGMPLRGLAKMSGGAMSMQMTQGLLTLVNGRHVAGLGQLVGSAVSTRRRHRRLSRAFHHASTTDPAASQKG